MNDSKNTRSDNEREKIGDGAFFPGPEADFLDGISRTYGHKEETRIPPSVGERIKGVRESKSLTLTDMAQRTGFSEETIAGIEKGEILPPLGDMVKLAKALEMKMGYLLAQGEAKPYTVVRKKDRKPISRYDSQRTQRYGYVYETLAPEKKERNMEPFLVTLVPTPGEEPPSTHEGEEFIFVLEGEVEVLLGDEREILTVEDSIYYDSTMPHRVRALGDGNARILAVLYTQEK
jgi:transcriptional regulator with XRE-family HTH domain